MKYQIQGDFVFTQKAAGLNSHASDHGKLGFVELLQKEMATSLYVVHRLDKATSGALVFAKNKEAAANLSLLFEQHKVEKKYLFLTDKKIESAELTICSYIEKAKNTFTSNPHSATPNAKTILKKIKTIGATSLWQATPLSGKPHQIRLHAQDAGLPILGDAEHGGSPYYRLCLHSQSLKYELNGQLYQHIADDPIWLEELDPTASLILDSIQKRSFIYDLHQSQNDCLRLLHNESTRFRIDQFGPQLWVYWYDEIDPTETDLAAFATVQKKIQKPIFIRKMNNRGANPNAKSSWTLGEFKSEWLARENNILFSLSASKGQSPGLFLDQRENRWWVRMNSQDLEVLNLFSYTGGFSLNAAIGKAKLVCTVDVSTKFNDWTKENFKLNQLNPEEKKYEFWSQDSLLFLKACLKRKRFFDLIICDPPSFGRSKNGVFQIQKDIHTLIELNLGCLRSGGRLLFSTNYESWDLEELRKKILSVQSDYQFELTNTPLAGLDYELPDEKALMKSLLIIKK